MVGRNEWWVDGGWKVGRKVTTTTTTIALGATVDGQLTCSHWPSQDFQCLGNHVVTTMTMCDDLCDGKALRLKMSMSVKICESDKSGSDNTSAS
jgi:hypothetical protein